MPRQVAGQRADAQGLQAVQQRVEVGEVAACAAEHEQRRRVLDIGDQQATFLAVAVERFDHQALAARAGFVELPTLTSVCGRLDRHEAVLLPGVKGRQVDMNQRG
ncbi:hypothetical protein D3C77_673200 [compost metagenome]